ncbi:hypothetical protein PR048_005258 [Dryococelus australis]|uniref:Uncharacterized protein n=1 Tax=Dryococelus australis TaxID=614101 RepID=A0ABQ9I7Q3_9NEOP|nr:hypothetical protein PR048_005258 [Dryococelus australis]
MGRKTYQYKPLLSLPQYCVMCKQEPMTNEVGIKTSPSSVLLSTLSRAMAQGFRRVKFFSVVNYLFLC